MKRLAGLITIIWLIFLANFVFAVPPPQLKNVISQLEKEGFAREETEKIFSDARVRIYWDIATIKGRGVNYFDKKFGFFNKESLQKGKIFLLENSDTLKRAEKTFRVEKEVIVGVLAIESKFGKTLGERSLLNTFYSLLVLNINPELTSFAEREIINLFLMVRQEGYDIFEIKGSYMGAFGLPQFLPSSLLNYGMDGDGDGRVNLFLKTDAIFSIGNYLRQNGYSSSFYDKVSALMRYNNDRNYALAVLLYAAMLKQ